MAGGQKRSPCRRKTGAESCWRYNGASGGRIRAMAGVKKPRLVVVDKDRSGWNTSSSYLLRRTGSGILDATFGVEGFATRFVTLF